MNTRILIKDVLHDHNITHVCSQDVVTCGCGNTYEDYDIWLSHAARLVSDAVDAGRNTEAQAGQITIRDPWSL